jgi:dipeptidyl-peptidase-4
MMTSKNKTIKKTSRLITKNKIPGLLFLVLIVGLALWAGEKADPSFLDLERIFTSAEFKAERFGPARWLKNGKGYTTLEDSRRHDKGRDIVRYDPKTGKRHVLVPAKHLIPKGKTSPLKIEDYRWSPDGKQLLIFTDTKRVWRRNTKGDYWVLNLRNRKLQKIGGKAGPSTLMFAKFSPQGDRVAYVSLNNIYVENLKDSHITPITSDGTETLINGTFDWVYEEEFSLRDGFRWSPDGKFIAYWQLDSSEVKEFYLINNTDSLYPKITAFKYPKAGETNSAGRVGIVNAQGGKTTWLDVPGDPRNNYIARMEWAANSKEVLLQYLNRLQNTNRVMLGDVFTGEIRTVFTDRDDTWVEVCDDLKWLNHGKSFTFVSERDGWQHVYKVSRSGENIELITPGEFDVISIENIDEEHGWLYYIAAPKNPAQRYLFRSLLNGSGKPERLTPVNLPGSHSYQVSPGSKWAFHTYSDFAVPTTINLIRLPSHRKVRTLVKNVSLKDKVKALKRSPVEFFRVEIEKGVLLDGWCMKPPGFDAAKKYPVLFYVYGEPWGQTVQDKWSGNRYLWHLMLTQQGYIVMSVDNRGTNAPRGREWRKCIYRQIGILASADQASALKAIIEKFSYVDASRIGIWGWSGGGSMSLNAIFRYPELYQTAMSVASVSNQRFYDSIYQERYMGLPKDNPEGFENGSPVTHAHKLKGNLLLIHGTGDDNCHYQGCEVLINELIAHNKYFTMMAYPNRSHGIYEGENTTRHLYELLTRYLKENLPLRER